MTRIFLQQFELIGKSSVKNQETKMIAQKTRKHSTCQLYVLQRPRDVSTIWGEGLYSPMNKFEQVSSDDHQMSLADGARPRRVKT